MTEKKIEQTCRCGSCARMAGLLPHAHTARQSRPEALVKSPCRVACFPVGERLRISAFHPCSLMACLSNILGEMGQLASPASEYYLLDSTGGNGYISFRKEVVIKGNNQLIRLLTYKPDMGYCFN